ncbi:MAG: DedA family protein [Candidatus Marinimicrobia bacterium]|nr:DedA family protein [Candidatus Neomarinimicrobiota bacterium]
MFKILRRLYDWVLHWAKTPYGTMALFLLSLSEASFFPIPPDVLLIALALGSRKQSYKFALICSIASIIGAIGGYCIGNYLWWAGDGYNEIALFFFNHVPGFSESVFLDIKKQYDYYGFIITFTAGFTPIPFKVFTISAGAFNISFPLFLLASSISRSARFFLVSFLIVKYGEQVEGFINRYFNLLTIAFAILLIGSYILLKFIIGN